MSRTYKLKSLTCSVIKFKGADREESYVDSNVPIENSPWVTYLRDNDTGPLYESFYATQKHPDHKDDYWYDVKNFDRLVESIKHFGYKNELCNNPKFQDRFNGKSWQGGKGTIKIGNGRIGDGHHRCAILYRLYGPDYIIHVNNCIVSNVPPCK